LPDRCPKFPWRTEANVSMGIEFEGALNQS
jgi:hypothetical protein